MNIMHLLQVNIDNIWTYLLPLLLIFSLLKLFYKIFEINWPELYFSASDIAGYYISVTPIKYFAFRLAPVVISTTFILGIFSKNLNQNEINIIGIMAGLIYSLTTHGVAILKLLLHLKSVQTYINIYSQYLFHIFSFVLIIMCSFLAASISKTDPISNLTPTLPGLVDNVWSSLITGMIAVYLYKIYQGKDVEMDQIVNKSFKQIDPEIINFIDSYSLKRNADSVLVKAVCAIENIQRPLWVRQFEKFKSFFIKEGTYGIMQVHSPKFITDKESVKIAIDRYFENSQGISSDRIESLVRNYNADNRYVDLIMNAYYNLTPNYY